MIGNLYKTAIANQAQTAAKTLIEIAAPADAVVTVERYQIGQSSFDTAENLNSTGQRITTTGTGTATTPRPLEEQTPAAGSTVETNSTVEPTYDTEVLMEEPFNVLSGLVWTPSDDDELIVLSPSQLFGINLDVAPSASMDFSYSMLHREMGG